MTGLTLNRLDEREIAAMIERIVGNKALPANVRQEIMERTDGVPLFVEEMTKAVLEAGGEGGRGTIAAHSVRNTGPGKPARFSDGAA